MTLPSDLTLKQDLLNASRFIAITRKTLSTCGDYIDTDKLYQLIATLTFICKSLDSLTTLTPKAAALQVQLEDLREELSSKLYFANEMKKINSQTLCKESDHVSTAILSVLPSCILTSESEHMHSRDADIVSGERIHSLLQQQKHISTQEIEQEKKTQVAITAELVNLTGILKEATMQMSTSVVKQNMQLESIQLHASDNFAELSKQKKKMAEGEKDMTKSLISTVGSIFWVIALFVLTYGVIRLFPKPRN